MILYPVLIVNPREILWISKQIVMEKDVAIFDRLLYMCIKNEHTSVFTNGRSVVDTLLSSMNIYIVSVLLMQLEFKNYCKKFKT